jgi:hypothetical protein
MVNRLRLTANAWHDVLQIRSYLPHERVSFDEQTNKLRLPFAVLHNVGSKMDKNLS